MTQTTEERRVSNREAVARYKARNREAQALYRARPEVKARRAEYQARYYRENRERLIAQTRAAYYADHEARLARLERQVNQRFNISRAEWLERQGNRCAICRAEFDDKTLPNVDHDHGCCPGGGSCGKCVRGVLCHHCNKGLGNFRDRPELLTAALTYLGQPAKEGE